MTHPISTPPLLSEQAYMVLREAIIRGEMNPGERIVETVLAGELNMSQAPVREALRRLEEEGLVENRPRRGSFVAKIDAKDLQEIMAVRAVLEGLAAREVAEHGIVECMDALQDLMDGMRQDAANSDLKALTAKDYEYHDVLCRLCQNRTLYRHWSIIHARIRFYLNFANISYPYPVEIAEGHQPLIDAMRHRNPDLAERRARIHVHESYYKQIEPMLAPKDERDGGKRGEIMEVGERSLR